MNRQDMQHIAYVLLHSGFDTRFDTSIGGCYCEICCEIRQLMDSQRSIEADAYQVGISVSL